MFSKVTIAGKSNYVFKIKKKKQKVSGWKKEIILIEGRPGIDVPSCRVKAESPTFGEVVLFFFEKNRTKLLLTRS